MQVINATDTQTNLGLDSILIDAVILAHYLCETNKLKWPTEHGNYKRFLTDIVNNGVPSSNVSRAKELVAAMFGDRLAIFIDVDDKPQGFRVTIGFMVGLAEFFNDLATQLEQQSLVLQTETNRSVEKAWAYISVQRYFSYAHDTLHEYMRAGLEPIFTQAEAAGATLQ